MLIISLSVKMTRRDIFHARQALRKAKVTLTVGNYLRLGHIFCWLEKEMRTGPAPREMFPAWQDADPFTLS